MAEFIGFQIAEVLKKLLHSSLPELEWFCGIRGQLDNLRNALFSIKAVLLDAEEQQFNNILVEDWVSKLKDVLYDIDDLFDELSYEILRREVMGTHNNRRKTFQQVRIFFSKSNQIASALKIGRKIKHIKERLKAIDVEKNQFHFSEQIVDKRAHEFRETAPFIMKEELIGRNDNKKEIKQLLLNSNTKEDIAVISIVGIGGLGKTALAKFVYNDDEIIEHFELKLWVYVSEKFDVIVIIKQIIEFATSERTPFDQFNSLQSELKRIIGGKKYLLVMDDVWNEDDKKWVTLKRALIDGAKGSRILITTRSEKVANTFETTSLYYLRNLDEGNSWLLFMKITSLEEDLVNLRLVEIGKEIVAKLEGVPLAIEIIGRFLYDNKSEYFWSSFKEKELYQAIEQRDQLKYMLQILKLSYNHLPYNLKQCFLYCALFPKNFNFQKVELIKQWMAQGFIQPNNKDKVVDIGENYFMELLSRSFVHDVKKNELGDIMEFKLQNSMHDLACSIVGNEYVHDLNDSTLINKRTHHISVHLSPWEKLEKLPENLSEARNLRTFMIQYSAHSWNKRFKELFNFILRLEPLDFENFFHDHLRLRTLHLELIHGIGNHNLKFFESIGKLKHLRYLSFSNLDIEVFPDSITKLYNLETFILHKCTKLKKLPADIKNLINLEYLSLCWNENIEFLPNSITQLTKLETLVIRQCSELKELPRNTKNLINLTHLDMHGCNALTHMPKGLGELTNLQTINLFVLGKDNVGGLSELNGLNKLRGSLTIKELQFCTYVDQQVNRKFLKNKLGLQELRLVWKDSFNGRTTGSLDNDYERVLECLQPHSNLREICIEGYKGVKLCDWLSFKSLGCLVTIKLIRCEKLQHLSQLVQFPNLKHLRLENLPNIKYICDNDFVSSSTFFPSLEKLSIVGMPELTKWWKDTTSMESIKGSFSITFPCLSELNIFGCLLQILNQWHAPLKSLEIGDSEASHHIIEEDEFKDVPWKNFENLSSLTLSKISKLECLPQCLQDVTSLQHLSLYDCKKLRSLPKWIGNLKSLKKLEIKRCIKLTSLPEEIRHIQSLQSLRIWGCLKLGEGCMKETGEDWPKIQHIHDVRIY